MAFGVASGRRITAKVSNSAGPRTSVAEVRSGKAITTAVIVPGFGIK